LLAEEDVVFNDRNVTELSNEHTTLSTERTTHHSS